MDLYILDSDHLSLYQRGHESIKSRLASIPPGQVAITLISVEELLRGRLAQVRRAAESQSRLMAYHWLHQTVKLVCCLNILKFDASAEKLFEPLTKQKIRIGTQDLKIASVALSQNAILVTRNQKDFERIPSLKIQDWSIQG